MQNILRFLQDNKSTYTTPFSKLQEEVQRARAEANENYRYLYTLKDLFTQLQDASSSDFPNLHELFIPIMHTVLMIYTQSSTYNQPPRLVVLIPEICNAVIQNAQKYVTKDEIFSLITNKETTEACEKL